MIWVHYNFTCLLRPMGGLETLWNLCINKFQYIHNITVETMLKWTINTCVVTVAVRLFGHRVHNRREYMQHEDHRRHQTRHEEDSGRSGSASAQEPGTERRSCGGVWRELSRESSQQCQGRSETPLTCLRGEETKEGHGRNKGRSNTSTVPVSY